MNLTWVWRNLIRHRIRTALAVSGIAVAGALLLDMTLLSGGMERSFGNMLLSRGFQIRLSPKGTLPFDTEATIPDASQLLAAIRADEDVALAGPVVGSPVHLRIGDTLRTVVGYGIDPEAQGLYQLDQGKDLITGDTAGVLLGTHLANRGGWQIGDTITLLGRLDPQTAVAGSEQRVVVRGVVTFLYDARGQLSLAADYRLVQQLSRLAGADVASMIMVKAQDDSLVDGVAERIAARHRTVEVNSVAALVRHFRARMVYFRQLSFVLATISLIVSGLLVGTILTIAVNERLGEIAVLRAIGVARSRVVRLVVAEGLVLTVAGASVGIVLGLLTARRLDAILTAFPGLPAVISFFVPERWGIARAGGSMLAAGLIAAAYPAWLASRAPIATTLRAEAE